jgi:hypothetical protein
MVEEFGEADVAGSDACADAVSDPRPCRVPADVPVAR